MRTKRPTYRPKHRKRLGIARRFNDLCDSEVARAVKTSFEWLMILQFIVQILQALLDALLKLI